MGASKSVTLDIVLGLLSPTAEDTGRKRWKWGLGRQEAVLCGQREAKEAEEEGSRRCLLHRQDLR